MFYRSHRGVNLSREVATSVAGGGYHDDYSYRFILLPYADFSKFNSSFQN